MYACFLYRRCWSLAAFVYTIVFLLWRFVVFLDVIYLFSIQFDEFPQDLWRVFVFLVGRLPYGCTPLGSLFSVLIWPIIRWKAYFRQGLFSCQWGCSLSIELSEFPATSFVHLCLHEAPVLPVDRHRVLDFVLTYLDVLGAYHEYPIPSYCCSRSFVYRSTWRGSAGGVDGGCRSRKTKSPGVSRACKSTRFSWFAS